MSRGPDAATLLKRALERHADAAGCDITLRIDETRGWASATFAGARHTITLTLRDDARGALWLGDIGEADLPMRGHLVADLVTLRVARRNDELRVTLEALTVEA